MDRMLGYDKRCEVPVVVQDGTVKVGHAGGT